VNCHNLKRDNLMTTIAKIQTGNLNGRRLRHAGSNARLGDHGVDVREPVVMVTLDDGTVGVGTGKIAPEQAQQLLGTPLDRVLTLDQGVAEPFLALDFALWDALARQQGKPVYTLLNPSLSGPFRVPCYDTSLYFDDLHLDDDTAAAVLVAENARQGYERGHRAFKIKVGRGALHMPLDAGTRRDIAIINAVREAVGPDCPVMIDANNGYNVNLVKQVLSAAADVYWIEEPFHEDPVLYNHLRDWMDAEGLSVLLADGEGDAAPHLMEWAQIGILDVVQYDVRQYGFSRWLGFARDLDAWGAKSAPHNYGSAFGEYVSCHLAAAIENFTFVEWDQIDLDGLDASGYTLEDGHIHVPDAPGFGLTVDPSALEDGFTMG
jgi:L-rhamnonate dehydratase